MKHLLFSKICLVRPLGRYSQIGFCGIEGDHVLIIKKFVLSKTAIIVGSQIVINDAYTLYIDDWVGLGWVLLFSGLSFKPIQNGKP